jgi:hypothetical protein
VLVGPVPIAHVLAAAMRTAAVLTALVATTTRVRCGRGPRGGSDNEQRCQRGDPHDRDQL